MPRVLRRVLQLCLVINNMKVRYESDGKCKYEQRLIYLTIWCYLANNDIKFIRINRLKVIPKLEEERK